MNKTKFRKQLKYINQKPHYSLTVKDKNKLRNDNFGLFNKRISKGVNNEEGC